ncbi:protein UBASH3A homolog isoform X1 [Polistes fuscatus]|uniref:protein UBASH3A homolog isoform X1 n=1 Tax=Polistes fuscatus TaxID=30207 RepID=UPI001CA8F617|nr:protein UBASH3A homolog isoform X1 [Polistes fuscatus]
MATLPPRKNPSRKKIFKQQMTPLQTLLQLGFPKHRAEKALAATGHRGIQLASDWLLAHVKDPTLDFITHRQYVLYACPTGALAETLSKFWVESEQLGWNGALNYMPHITLVSFFQVSDELEPEFVYSLNNIIDRNEPYSRVHLEPYISPNFMGLFVKDEDAKWLNKISANYAAKLSTFNIVANHQVKPLHLTLAYQFPSNLFQPLRTMVEKLEPATVDNWELRLYSRDSRLKNSRVHKVIYAYTSREDDDLELRVGDYIYIMEESYNSSTDGWIEGTSWLTGATGNFPLNHTKRTAESDSWTLHYTVQINNNVEDIVDEEKEVSHQISSTNVEESVNTTRAEIESIESTSSSSSVIPARQLVICRHGERVDFTFGEWIPYCFEDGSYIRRDLNMPKVIPTRNIDEFKHDGPITSVGELQARLIGDAIKSSKIQVDAAFTSPFLRCIQTLNNILKGLELDIPIKIEPGLTEWLAWYPAGVPTWMTPTELINAGYNVDTNYNHIIEVKDLTIKETSTQYYERSYKLIKHIIENTKGNILIVGHASTLSALTKQLTGGEIPPPSEITKIAQKISYLACAVTSKESNGWQLQAPPFPPITHTSNSKFDWKVLL